MISILALAVLDQLLTGGEMRQHVEDLALGATGVHPPEFPMLPPLNRCNNTGRLFVVVHFGYLADQGYLQSGYVNPVEGSYPVYWKNTRNLITALSQSREPALIAVQDRDFQRNRIPSTGYSSPLVTINTEGRLKRYVHTRWLTGTTYLKNNQGLGTIWCRDSLLCRRTSLQKVRME